MTIWLTLKQCASYLGVSESTIRRMIKAGEIPFRMLGSRYRFDRDEVDAWIKNENPCQQM